MDNKQIAHVLAEIADLLEIKGDNAFKIRAYRTASDTLGAWPRKEALILKAIEEREKDFGRHLLPDTTSVLAELLGYLKERAPHVDYVAVGSLRRGCETCGDIDILATGGDRSLMDVFVEHPKVERVLGHGDTKSSVRMWGGYQADLRLVPSESRGAAMQYFTGSKAHNIVLRDRAIQRGLKLNEYGLFRVDGLTLLAGIECDILTDGTLDLSDDCLAQLDIVVASVHSHFSQDEAQMTDRVLKALENRWVDVLGHPTGRLLLKREPLRLNMDRVTSAAARLGVALEINCQVDRLDLNDAHARLARERGVRLVISTDAHSTTALGNLRWGVQMARRAWAGPDDVLNTRSADDMRRLLRRNRPS